MPPTIIMMTPRPTMRMVPDKWAQRSAATAKTPRIAEGKNAVFNLCIRW